MWKDSITRENTTKKTEYKMLGLFRIRVFNALIIIACLKTYKMNAAKKICFQLMRKSKRPKLYKLTEIAQIENIRVTSGGHKFD